jgi:DNA-binding MarR family transcriptional regulator
MTQAGFDFTPLARRSDPDTSHDAARRIEPAVSSLELRVVGALLEHRSGLTAREIAVVIGERDGSVTPRMPALKDEGFVRTTGAKRDGSRIWVAC